MNQQQISAVRALLELSVDTQYLNKVAFCDLAEFVQHHIDESFMKTLLTSLVIVIKDDGEYGELSSFWIDAIHNELVETYHMEAIF